MSTPLRVNLSFAQQVTSSGLNDLLNAHSKLTLLITHANGETQTVPLTLRISTPIEVEYYCHGRILPFVSRQLVVNA